MIKIPRVAFGKDCVILNSTKVFSANSPQTNLFLIVKGASVQHQLHPMYEISCLPQKSEISELNSAQNQAKKKFGANYRRNYSGCDRK